MVWGVSMRIEPIHCPPCPSPTRAVAAPCRGGTDDSRRHDAGRDEACVTAFGAGPGSIPFADYLKASNLRDRAGADRAPGVEPAEPAEQGAWREWDTDRSAHAEIDVPRLGDVSPIEAEPAGDDCSTETAAGRQAREVYLRPASTGRMIDVVI